MSMVHADEAGGQYTPTGGGETEGGVSMANMDEGGQKHPLSRQGDKGGVSMANMDEGG
jgi:hypothetical protein